MTILLDTHVVIWWLEESDRLSRRAVSILANKKNMLLVSPASAWELSIKVNLGKIIATDILTDLENELSKGEFAELAIDVRQAIRAGSLPQHHRDPFDRLLVAQAQSLNLPILSADKLLDNYGVQRIW